MTAKMTRWYELYKQNRYKDLYDFYKKPSSRKISAWAIIKQNHPNACVLNGDTFNFTAAYIEDGVFVVKTSCNTYREKLPCADFNVEVCNA